MTGGTEELRTTFPLCCTMSSLACTHMMQLRGAILKRGTYRMQETTANEYNSLSYLSRTLTCIHTFVLCGTGSRPTYTCLIVFIMCALKIFLHHAYSSYIYSAFWCTTTKRVPSMQSSRDSLSSTARENALAIKFGVMNAGESSSTIHCGWGVTKFTSLRVRK